MVSGNPETADAIRYWLVAATGILFCVIVGKLVAQTGSAWIMAFFLAVGVSALTFYSPKAALGIIVFSMMLSPKVPGWDVTGGRLARSLIIIRFDDVLLIMIFFAWLARSAVVKERSFLLLTPVHLPIFFYTLACLVSTALGIAFEELHPVRSGFYVLKYVEYFILFFLAVNIIEDREDIRKYLWCGWITAVAVTLYGYFQVPQGGRIIAPFEAPLNASIVERSQYGEPNTLGGYFLVVFGVLLGVYTQQAGRTTVFALASLLFMLFPFFMTLSRSSYIGLTAALLFLMWATPKKRLSVLFGIGFSAVLFFMVPSMKKAVSERIAYTFTGSATPNVRPSTYEALSREGVEFHLEGSALARLMSWDSILFHALPKRPLFGAGVTGVGLVDSQLPLVLGETGLFGFSLFVWMLLSIWKCAWAVFRQGKNDLDRALALGLLTTLVGLLFHSLGANSFIVPRIMEPFWFLTAIVSRLYVLDIRQART